MLRLAIQSTNQEETVLEAHGRIAGQDVAFLEQEGEQALRQGQGLTLDLDGVRFIDRAGVELLRGWTDRGVTLRGGFLFIRAILRPPDPE